MNSRCYLHCYSFTELSLPGKDLVPLVRLPSVPVTLWVRLGASPLYMESGVAIPMHFGRVLFPKTRVLKAPAILVLNGLHTIRLTVGELQIRLLRLPAPDPAPHTTS